jgi:glycosyltransferase involved in cell wall biosynthesis
LVVPAGSAVALANAMTEVVKANSELLNNLGQEGTRRIVEDYDVVRNSLKLEEFIAKVSHCNG